MPKQQEATASENEHMPLLHAPQQYEPTASAYNTQQGYYYKQEQAEVAPIGQQQQDQEAISNDGDKQQLATKANGSYLGSSLTLANCALGSGILALRTLPQNTHHYITYSL